LLANAIKAYDINGNVLSSAPNKSRIYTNPAYMITTKDNDGNIVWDSTQFVFTGITGSYSGITSDLQYISYNTEKSLNIVCLASSSEFYKSTNDTARELITSTLATDDFSSFQSQSQNLYPITITSLGIHDAAGNLLAICKPTQPVKKYWYDVVSFNVKIRL
jgi:hypothetical protein